MNISASELNKKPGTYLDKAQKEPVIIEKTGRPAVVMVSYERFIELEDAYWGERAILADKGELANPEEVKAFLHGDD